MAVPSYTTDLIDIDLGEAGGKTWAEPTAAGWTLGATPSVDAENFIQGSGSISKAFNATGVGGMMVNNTAGITLPADGAFFGWFYWASPSTLETDVNGGLRFMVGSSLAAFLSWDVGGRTSYVYGGWINYVINTTVTPDDVVSTGLGNSQYVGMAFYNTDAITKGSPGLCDAFRYGRGEARFANGSDADGYATFNGFSAVNDANSYRWGLIQSVNGSYLVKGLVVFGYGAAVDFRDSNKAIFIQNTNKVTSNFNTFEVRNASSRVDLTSITITALGTVSKGRWITTDNAIQNITNCVFTDMGVFGYASNSTLLGTTFRRCGLVTQNSAVLTGCTFDSTADATKALLSNNPTLITGCKFVSAGTKHAVEINTSGEYNLVGNTFTGYATTHGSSGNEVIYNNSGSHVVLNASSNIGVVSYRNGSGATTSVVSSITLTLSGLKDGSDISILNAGTETERINVQQNSGTTYNYNYASAGESIDIGIFKTGYVPLYVRGYILGTTNGSLPISQVIDRAYLE